MSGELLYSKGIGMTRHVLDNLKGRYERWTILRKSPDFERFTRAAKPLSACRYVCQCDCGTVRLVRSINLHSGSSGSCGCLQRELVGARARVMTLEMARTALALLQRGEHKKAVAAEVGVSLRTIYSLCLGEFLPPGLQAAELGFLHDE